MKATIKKLSPRLVLNAFRYARARFAEIYYGKPSEKLIVIGITGTKGKSSTANFVWAALSGAGMKTGLLGTANIKIGEREELNVYHMTMPSPMIIQKRLKEMADSGCAAAIIETTSEGIAQFRHAGIHYDILIFTNLTPEHIRSHGSFEKYREAKQNIFRNLAKNPKKKIGGMEIPQTIIVNADSSEAPNFSRFPADLKITFGANAPADIEASNILETSGGVSFETEFGPVRLKTLGRFNVSNALPALAVAKTLSLPLGMAIKGLESLEFIPGRMEVITDEPFTVIVDYAHERQSMTALLTSIRSICEHGKIILLLGAEGGGRDLTKRSLMGEIGAKMADYLIVSNVDPYEEEPRKIINDIAAAAIFFGKREGHDLFLIEDREEGIRKAVSLAKPGDFVLITGKGSEQSMIIGNRRFIWDDREVTRKVLRGYNK